MINAELTLDQLHGIQGGLLSAEEVVDFWIKWALGDVIDDITKNQRRVEENDEAGSDGQSSTTETTDSCQPDFRRYL